MDDTDQKIKDQLKLIHVAVFAGTIDRDGAKAAIEAAEKLLDGRAKAAPAPLASPAPSSAGGKVGAVSTDGAVA